jgi:hypothetical protein
LIVPGLMLGSGMPILNAIGSSLFSVGSFGLTTAINYALSGLIDWTIALLFIVGGVGGGIVGMHSAIRLASNRRMLTYIFCERHLRRRHLHAGAHRPSILAVNSMRTAMGSSISIPCPGCSRLLDRR